MLDLDLENLQPSAFQERYSPWTHRAWLDIEGTRRIRVPIEHGYGALRQKLRRRFPDRPWQSDWSDGRFPAAPFGLPMGIALLLATLAWLLLLLGAGIAGGGAFAVAVALAGAWPVARMLDGVEISRQGVRVGPPWAPLLAWHEVSRLGVVRVGRETRLWVLHRHGASSGSVPAVLLPAVRARLRKLGALPLEPSSGGLDVRYASWRAAAAGIPWGALLGTLAASPAVAFLWGLDPFLLLISGGLVALGLALLGAAVEARATGWGTGAIGWLTLLHALILGIFAVGSW